MLDRRRFLKLAVGGAALGLATAGCAAGAGYDDAALARPELLAAMGSDTLRAIGARYRETSPRERDVPSLRGAILASRPISARLFGVAHPVADLVRDDFVQGRTVVVDGWVLSLTEARQCALFSLLPA
jgi:hypothetical protein